MKNLKITAVLAALLMSFPCISGAASAEESTVTVKPSVSGDVNGDDVFNLSDMIMYSRWLLGKGSISVPSAGDVNKDLKTDIFDYIEMKKILLSCISDEEPDAEIIKEFEALLAEHRFELPDFLFFTPEEWETKGHEYDEIRDNMLGWDVTDYGEGDYAHLGLALITIRNGNVHDPKYTKCYAEKIMMCKPGQVSPMHFHWNKMEDIINAYF